MISGMVRASFWAKEKARSFNRAFSRVLICVTLASFCGDCLMFLGFARHSLSDTAQWRCLSRMFPPIKRQISPVLLEGKDRAPTRMAQVGVLDPDWRAALFPYPQRISADRNAVLSEDCDQLHSLRCTIVVKIIVS